MFDVRTILIDAYLALFDLAVAACCYLALLYVEGAGGGSPNWLGSDRILSLGWVLGVWLFLLWYFRMYHSRRMATLFADVGIVLRVSVAGLIVLEALAHLVPALRPTPLFLAKFAALTCVAMAGARVAVRMLLRELRRRGHNLKNLVLVTGAQNGERIAQKISRRTHYGYRIVRRLEFGESGQTAEEELFEQFCAAVAAMRVDDVILALPGDARALTSRLVEVCESRGINVRIVPDLFPLVQTETQVYNLDGIPLINVHLYPTELMGYVILKRAFDILASLAVLIVLAPLLLVIALLVKLTSRGPVFFVQERVGLNGKKFKMLKFRTMRADPSLDPETHWTTAHASHVTPLGRWLRRSNLDELPQFLNVLTGDMSVVGPRPERPYFIERFRQEIPDYMLRHYVKCGITGWAQVNGWRGDTSIRERVAHDLYYLRNWGIALDIKILVWTVTKSFFHPNAY
ncbi:MAG: undecaprenyl-phosphate glucose phosphotransferase [Terriglobia bacterium]